MADDQQKSGNVLVDPADYASRLLELDSTKDSAEIARLEDHLGHRIRLGGAITYIDENGIHVIEDRNGIQPFTEAVGFPSPPECAELEIRELAFINSVSAEVSDLDQWCDSASANAGDEVESDEVERLIIGLRRKQAHDGIELTKLHARYLKERTESHEL